MQVDVFSDGYQLSSNAGPSQSTLQLGKDGVLPSTATGEGDGLPTLAQLLQETVNSLGVGTSGQPAIPSANSVPALPSLPTLSSPASRNYISALLSKDLPSLLKEPEELAKQSDLLDADLAHLCYRSIGDLLGVGECVDGVQDGFGQMQSTLDSLLACTEQLSTSCISFTASINPILSSRTRLSLVRSNISSIEDILSIPRLVSTCVRGGWWSEAMELAYRARDLEQILKPQKTSLASDTASSARTDLLAKVRQEVEVEIKSLRARILEGLRSRSLKLPAAVRSISLLRRISTSSLSEQEASSSLTEAELRMAFLTSRWDCLRSQLDQLEVSAGSGASSEDRLRYVKRWIEVWREVVGETVTIYNEIFLHHPQSSYPTESTKSHPKQITSDSPSSSTTSLRLENPQMPIALFQSQALVSLQSLLQNQLPQIASVSSLSSLQTQLSYCSTAFAKFGFDFRYLPNQLITQRVRNVLTDRFKQATEVFGRDLARAVSQSGARPDAPRIIINALIASEARSSILSIEDAEILGENSDSESGKAGSTQPQAIVSLFPPLAKFINAHAMALNELRLLPINSLLQPIQKAQYDNLVVSSQELENLISTAKATWSKPLPSSQLSDESELERQKAVVEEDRLLLKKFALTFAKCIIPWCRWALRKGVYPDSSKSMQEGQPTEGDEQDDRLREAAESLMAAVGIVKAPVDSPAPEAVQQTDQQPERESEPEPEPEPETGPEPVSVPESEPENLPDNTEDVQ